MSGWAPFWGSVPQSRPKLASGWVHLPPLLRSWRSTKWSLENNLAWFGQEKLSFSITICLRHPPPVSFSLSYQWWPLSRIKCESYIFITKCYGHSSSMYIYSLWLYISSSFECLVKVESTLLFLGTFGTEEWVSIRVQSID